MNPESEGRGVYQWQTFNNQGEGLSICQIHCSSRGSYDIYYGDVSLGCRVGYVTMKTTYNYIFCLFVDSLSRNLPKYQSIKVIISLHVIDEFKFQQAIHERKKYIYSPNCKLAYIIIFTTFPNVSMMYPILVFSIMGFIHMAFVLSHQWQRILSNEEHMVNNYTFYIPRYYNSNISVTIYYRRHSLYRIEYRILNTHPKCLPDVCYQVFMAINRLQ